MKPILFIKYVFQAFVFLTLLIKAYFTLPSGKTLPSSIKLRTQI